MKKVILELDPETMQATWIVKRGDKRTRYNPNPANVNRLDSLFIRLGLDHAMNYDGKFYLTTNAIERIEPEPVAEFPDDER